MGQAFPRRYTLPCPTDNQRAEEAQAARERPRDPHANWSGTWWSIPHGLVHTVGQIPAGLSLVEDSLGWEQATVISIRGTARTFEIRIPDDWLSLCRAFPPGRHRVPPTRLVPRRRTRRSVGDPGLGTRRGTAGGSHGPGLSQQRHAHTPVRSRRDVSLPLRPSKGLFYETSRRRPRPRPPTQLPPRSVVVVKPAVSSFHLVQGDP